MSLRARLLAGLALIGVVLVTTALVVTATTKNQLFDQVDARLTLGERPFLPGLDRTNQPGEPRRDGDGDGDGDGTSPRFERRSELFEGVLLSDGQLVTFYEPNLSDAQYPLPDLSDLGLTERSGSARVLTVDAVESDLRYRVRAQRLEGGEILIAALPLTDVDEALEQLILVEALGVLAVLAMLAGVAWWVIRLGIHPIERMTSSAAEIAASDLAMRVPEARPGTEAGELSTALNAMLGRIETEVDERSRSEDRLRRFVADASHELRTPVTTIRGYGELYQHGGLGERSDLDDAMRRTHEEALRMGRLVEEMLTLAKLDEQRPLALQPVDLAGLAADAASDARATAQDRPITVESDGVLVVPGDKDRLRQVLANIVGNALVHTPPATPIIIRTRRTDSVATIEVVDHGPGMPDEVAARITERFYRADPSRSRARGGSGLGMSIAEAVVRAHDGSIEVESRAGTGTTVRVNLPFSARFPLPSPAT